ncbi:Phosphatidylinositol 4-phosphate 5-kinase [Thalictrum thalictroides]|uniref:Phosphatidylinositol 4-phosphate 5-kinase n=1 Tax=Thalictrum thalictroides TaxID=46969 RepID=A0A7J6WM64_THATH|nr:Phosphatidylinositol 4-phosphate 5-kinase [Thalictrum thalictroides]
MLSSLQVILEDRMKGSYGIDGRPIQDAESFLFSLEGNIPGSTDIASTKSESQVTFQPSIVEEGVEANVTLSPFSVDVANPDGGLDIFGNVQKIPRKLNYSNGDSYEGTWENGLRHGQGRFVWANGDVYIGEWKNDVREGHGKITYKNGSCFEGTFRNSNPEEGHGKLTSKRGDYYEGTFRNFKKDGHGRYVWASGNEYSGEWKNDVREGQGRFVWTNGGIYIGEWKDDGGRLGKMIYKNGDYYEGMFHRNMGREGQGRYVLLNGDEYSGEWKNDVQEGHGKITYKNGDIWEGTYENGTAVKGRFTHRKSRFLRSTSSAATNEEAAPATGVSVGGMLD